MRYCECQPLIFPCHTPCPDIIFQWAGIGFSFKSFHSYLFAAFFEGHVCMFKNPMTFVEEFSFHLKDSSCSLVEQPSGGRHLVEMIPSEDVLEFKSKCDQNFADAPITHSRVSQLVAQLHDAMFPKFQPQSTHLILYFEFFMFLRQDCDILV